MCHDAVAFVGDSELKLRGIFNTGSLLRSLRKTHMLFLRAQANSIDFLISRLIDSKCIVEEFRLFGEMDSHNFMWEEWSRVYEYEFAINALKLQISDISREVHNTSWGFSSLHQLFKYELEKLPFKTLHSDIKKSSLPNTVVYNLKRPVPKNWINKFDVVLNISTLEEIESSQLLVLLRLLKMTKPGGTLIITFDVPGLKLQYFEEFLGKKLEEPLNPVTFVRNENDLHLELNVGVLMLQKVA